MSDSTPKRDVFPEDTQPRNVDPVDRGARHAEAGMDARDEPTAREREDQRGRERTNPHDDGGAPTTAAKTAGVATGMFFPVVILAVVAAALIIYLLFLR